jgi:hypothetical protein
MSEDLNGAGIQLRGEILASRGDVIMGEIMIMKIKLETDEDSDFLYVVLENDGNHLLILGVGLTFHEAIYDAERRVNEYNEYNGGEMIEKIEGLERAFRQDVL